MASNSTKTISGVFDSYQKARVTFVQNIAEFAQNPKNVDALAANKVMALLRPLLLDNVPSIQHNAAQALGRLASYSPELALSVVDGDILPQLVCSLATQNVSLCEIMMLTHTYIPDSSDLEGQVISSTDVTYNR